MYHHAGYYSGADDPGVNVRLYQQMLIELGYLPPGSDSGVKDTRTLEAVKKFQVSVMKIGGAGGDVGPKTLAAMTAAVAAKRAQGAASMPPPVSYPGTGQPGVSPGSAQPFSPTGTTAQPTGQPVPQGEPEKKEEKKMSTALIVGLSLGGVALTGGLIFLAFSMGKKKPAAGAPGQMAQGYAQPYGPAFQSYPALPAPRY